MYYTPPTCIRYAYAHSITGARVLTPYKEIGCGAIVMAGLLLLEMEVGRARIRGCVTELPQIVLPCVGGQAAGSARLARIAFNAVTR